MKDLSGAGSFIAVPVIKTITAKMRIAGLAAFVSAIS
jgi:hypothetical protein